MYIGIIGAMQQEIDYLLTNTKNLNIIKMNVGQI